MLTIVDIEKAGYKKYPNPIGHLADALYQKAIRRNGKRLFHINIYYYDRNKYGESLQDRDGFQTEVHFVHGSMTFHVDLYHGTEVDTQFIEQWFTNMFDSMNCTAIDDQK